MSGVRVALAGASWHGEPPKWSLSDEALMIVTGNQTDFWQETFYGFHRDDGHFFGVEAEGDFTAIVTFEGDYEILYDQAGIMMRIDAHTWLKAGVEFSDDITNFSVVITRDGQSDWSVIGVPQVKGPQKVRLTRLGGAVIVHYLASDDSWRLLRLGDFPATHKARVGPMACSPQRPGFEARFTQFEIGPPINKPLHGD